MTNSKTRAAKANPIPERDSTVPPDSRELYAALHERGLTAPDDDEPLRAPNPAAYNPFSTFQPPNSAGSDFAAMTGATRDADAEADRTPGVGVPRSVEAEATKRLATAAGKWLERDGGTHTAEAIADALGMDYEETTRALEFAAVEQLVSRPSDDLFGPRQSR